MMRRKITETLKKWKENDAAECALLIDGARRVGKSYIVEAFAKEAFPAYLLINFKYASRDVKETFEEYLNKALSKNNFYTFASLCFAPCYNPPAWQQSTFINLNLI